MKTTAIFTPVNISATPPATTKSAESASSKSSFNNVLNQEMTDRRVSSETSKQADNAPRSAEQQTKAPTNQTSSTAQKNPSSTSSSPVKKADSDKQEDAATEPTDAESATTALLAYVSGIAEVTAATKDDKKKDDLAGIIDGVVDPRSMIDIRIIANTPAAPATVASETTTVRVDPSIIVPTDIKGKGDIAKDSKIKPSTDFAGLTSRTTAEPELATALTSTLAAATKQTSIDLAAIKAQDNPNAVLMAPMQQTFAAAQAITGQATEKLTPNVGTAAWDQALGQKVVWMVAGAQQSATLTLNPPDLGPLQIVLNVNNTEATATFVAAQPEVRQALEAAMPKLREMLAEAGIQLGQTNVSTGNPNQNNNFSNQSQQSSGRSNQGSAEGEAPAAIVRTAATSSGTGLVDTFV